MDINTTLKTQLNAAGSPALPTNRRALLTYTGRSRVHADSTCAHDTRRTHDNDRRARPLRGTGRRLPALLGTRRWRYRDGPWASRAPSAPCPPSDRPPARRASCSVQRKESLYHRRRAAAARRNAARAPTTIHGLGGAVLHSRTQETLPGTVS